MQTLYDSEDFIVTHMLATADAATPEAAQPADANLLPSQLRHGFEIVDKRSGKEVYLDGPWAELFQQHIVDWQRKTPTQEEVEETISQYAELAHTPVLVH